MASKLTALLIFLLALSYAGAKINKRPLTASTKISPLNGNKKLHRLKLADDGDDDDDDGDDDGIDNAC